MKNNKIKIMALISGLMITSTLVSPIMSKSVVANEKLKQSSETNKKNLAPVPPMGWNSWNSFFGEPNEQLLKETADAIVEKGLADAGYEFVVLDDGYIENRRDKDGNLVPDKRKFPNGFKPVSDYIHEKGLKFGMYNSAGTGTCMGLPGSFGHEEKDAKQFAEWGIDYFKYDFCNNPLIGTTNAYAPDFDKFTLSKGDYSEVIEAESGELIGKAQVNNGFVGWIGNNEGELILKINAPESGEYNLAIRYLGADAVRKAKIDINGLEGDMNSFPKTSGWAPENAEVLNIKVNLNEGENTLRIYNEGNTEKEKMEAAYKSYKVMTDAFLATGRDVVFSVCEWGSNKPWLWANDLGHLWRTTYDITHVPGKASWGEIMEIYDQNVELAKYAGPNGWNDPDMLVVGLDGLNYEENKSHFTLWAAMAAPLMLGNDVRTMKQDVLDIITNKDVIALNQDTLGVQAYKIKDEGNFEVLAKPLKNGDVGIVLFNRSNKAADVSVTIDEIAEGVELVNEEDFLSAKKYNTKELWDKTEGIETTEIKAEQIPAHGVKTFRVSPTKDTEIPVEKPGKVENLSMLEATSNSIKLSWNAPTVGGEVSKYIIYKDGIKLDEVPDNINEYKITDLQENTLYGVKIVAVGIDGQLSRPVAKNVRTIK